MLTDLNGETSHVGSRQKSLVGNPTNLTFVRPQAIYSQRKDCILEWKATEDQTINNKEEINRNNGTREETNT